MNKIKSVLFMAGILLALGFVFSCSTGSGGEQSYEYCIMANNTCLIGPFTASTCTGQLSNSCPNGSNPSVGGSSSSRTGIFSSSSVRGSSSSSVGSDNIANYRTVQIGDQVWMAENLNYNVSGSKCYGEGGKVWIDNDNYVTLSNAEIQANCTKYGRLYTWAMAMGIDAKYNEEVWWWGERNVKHQGICPNGWHIPNNADWYKLKNYVMDECLAECEYDQNQCIPGRPCGGCGCSEEKFLKAKMDWKEGSNGLDTYNFSALPGGVAIFEQPLYFYYGDVGFWWSASEHYDYSYHGTVAYLWDVSRIFDEYILKSYLLSVRCVKD
ncbi:MAG: hypothetical protein LBC87_06125 [Fibromonadaceae bacterium]|nr:hypothetical protein [Fibromonadaceae bacterium]